jgi:hypothetical protein
VGDSLIDRLEKGIDECDYLAVILSPDSVSSEWVLKEVRMAMQREIAGKRVVVLPLLYRDCTLPGFLRDKIYADLRNAADYERGLQAVLERLQYDQSPETGLRKAHELADQVPLTALWKSALATGKFGGRFEQIIHEVLGRMSRPGKWNPGIAISYLLFMVEVKSRPHNAESWAFLRGIVEDKDINLPLRGISLARMIESVDAMQARAFGGLPDLFDATEDDNIVRDWLKTALDPNKEAAPSGMQDVKATTLLARLWIVAGPLCRQKLLRAIEQYAEGIGLDADAVTHGLQMQIADADQAKTEAAFTAMRETSLRAQGQDSQVALLREVQIAVQKLVQTRSAFSDCQEVVRLFRQATELEEQNNFEPYVAITELFSPEIAKEIRDLQGVKFAHELYSALVADPEIEVCLSVLALHCLVLLFGAHALWVDGRFPSAIFAVKRRGQLRGTVLDGLCDSAEGEDRNSLVLLTVIHDMLKEREKREFVRLAKVYAAGHPQVRLLLRWCKGEMTDETFRQKAGLAPKPQQRGSKKRKSQP